MKTLDLSRSAVRALAALALAMLTLPGRLAAEDPPDWTEAFPPFRIASNLYYVGSKGLVLLVSRGPPTPSSPSASTSFVMWAGGRMISYEHFDNNWFNAQWDGIRMRFGDGPGNAAPLVSIDIVGHEFTHGVTGNSAGLIYAQEPVALNESFSDIFGNAIEFNTPGATGNWLVGEGTVALRSMSNPNAFQQPDTYQGSFWFPVASPDDNGGVHTNSGVNNTSVRSTPDQPATA
jgi:hypothetical protein